MLSSRYCAFEHQWYFEHVSSISGVICGESFENNSNNEAKETKHEGM